MKPPNNIHVEINVSQFKNKCLLKPVKLGYKSFKMQILISHAL